MPLSRSATTAAAAFTALLLLAGCGPIGGVGATDGGPVPAPSSPDGTGVTDGVLYDGEWVITEGVWFLADGEKVREPGLEDGLIDASVPGVAWIFTPALYGKFRVRVEKAADAPPVPAWCEDVVEVSLRTRTGGLVMGGFEEFTDPMPVEPGTYRLRYCVTGLDAAEQETAEDEFDGDDYRLYSGRHLLQLWPAPAGPREVVRLGSAFARANQPT